MIFFVWFSEVSFFFVLISDKTEKITGTVTSPMYSVASGTIASPNFPHGYALNGEIFTYMIQNLDPYGHVQLVFDDWDLAEKSHIQVGMPFYKNYILVTSWELSDVIVLFVSRFVYIITKVQHLLKPDHYNSYRLQYKTHSTIACISLLRSTCI